MAANLPLRVTKFTTRNRVAATFVLAWDVRTIKRECFTRLQDIFMTETDYAPAAAERIRGVVADLNRQFDCKLSRGQALSIHNAVVKHKIITNYPRMNAVIDEIARKYIAGSDILDLSKAYDFPPLNLLRGIFLHIGSYTPGELYRLFVNRARPESYLTGRDLDQFLRAFYNDAESTINHDRIARIAEENEQRVVGYFRSLGIRLKTQNELVHEQKKLHGRAIATPDIVFLDDVIINGVRVHWLDYKDYAGTNIPFLYNSNVAQSQRYTAMFGGGAICYRFSFIDELYIPNTLLLNASALPVKLAKL